MTLKQFEQWFEKWREDVLVNTTEQFSLTLDQLIAERYLQDSFKRDILSEIKWNIDKVSPEEDRLMLILKYSDYLT